MHRFYLPPASCRGDAIRLDGREAHHALQVMRLKYGELVTVLDGAGHQFLCTVKDAGRGVVNLSVSLKNFVPAAPCATTLLVAVPKGKLIEGIIQKAVELGASRIVPLLTERVVAQLDDEDAAAKRDKWQQVAVEAIKQCGAAWLPAVAAPVALEQFLVRGEKFDLALVGSLQNERRLPREVLREFGVREQRPPRSVGIWIGPEGDFTSAELVGIMNSGAQPVTFGPLVLRVETAAIYGLSIVNYELQRD